MPTYEYECTKTGKRFEKFQSFSAKALTQCPDCGSPVRRLLGTGGGIIFKGSGFHATDYGRSSNRNPACGRDRTCCGRDTPCETPPCKNAE